MQAEANSHRTGLIMATITALSWAVLAIAIKLALRDMSASFVVWVRMVIAFLLLFTIFSWKRREWLQIIYRPPWIGVLAGILIAINYFGFMKGVELTTASNAQIMIQLSPMGFAALSILLFREIPTRRQALGMVMALIGFAFFYWDQILLALDEIDRFQAGNLWLIVAAVTWIGFALIQKTQLKIYKPQQFNLLMYAVAAIFLTPAVDFSEFTDLNGLDIGLLIFLSLNTVVAYGALSEALNRIPASEVSMILSVNPLLTLAIMTTLTQMEVEWIEGEPIHWRGFIGALFVVIGLILIVAKPARLSSARASSKI